MGNAASTNPSNAPLAPQASSKLAIGQSLSAPAPSPASTPPSTTGDANAAVQMYTGPNFHGFQTTLTHQQAAALPNGVANSMSDVGFVDKGLMSMKVAPGYRVKLYNQRNRKGNSVSIEGPQDLSDMANFSNSVCSMKVDKLPSSNMLQTGSSTAWFWAILIIILILLLIWAASRSSRRWY